MAANISGVGGVQEKMGLGEDGFSKLVP